MSRFVLQPCRIREDRVVPTKDEPVVLDAKELITKFAPNRVPKEKLAVRMARLGSFLGLCKGSRSGRTVPFIIWNPDRSNKIRWLLKQDEAFPDRLLEIYRLQEVDWGSSVEEIPSGKLDKLPGNNAQPRAKMTEV